MYVNPVICKCQHPVRIVDKVHGGYLYVPCGHCSTCVASSRSKWMQRLNQEAEQSAYVLFFTLTYNNDNLPIFFDNGDGYYSSNRGLDFDLNSYIDNGKLNYVNCPRPQNYRKFAGERIFASVCKKDVQDFFKRLRRKLEVDSRSLLLDSSFGNRKFKYFVASEYGPETFRPHYHGILFFKDAAVGLACEEHYLRESWKLCDRRNIDVGRVQTNACGYVAKYVKCYTKLPFILSLPDTRPFVLASRQTAIGADYMSDSVVDTIFENSQNCTVKIVTDQNGTRQIDVPISNIARNAIFPKLLCQCSISTSHFYEFLARYCSLSGIRPRRCRTTKELVNLYNIRNLNSSVHKTWSMCYHEHLISRDEFIFSVPQNITAFRRMRNYMLSHSLTVGQYIDMWNRYYSIANSSAMRFFYDFVNFSIQQGLEAHVFLPYMFPDIKESLPLLYNKEQIAIVNSRFQAYEVDFSELYYPDMVRHLELYQDSSLFKDYSGSVSDSDLKFEKIRHANHFINQNSKNYESF